MKINQNYLNVKKSYLFTEIGNRVRKFQSDNPDAEVIKLGIGDVTLPLAPVVIDAMKKRRMRWEKSRDSTGMVLSRDMIFCVKLFGIIISKEISALRQTKYLSLTGEKRPRKYTRPLQRVQYRFGA